MILVLCHVQSYGTLTFSLEYQRKYLPGDHRIVETQRHNRKSLSPPNKEIAIAKPCCKTCNV